ncbi:MAG: hypothetical protein H7X95_13005 [Deltaproteobacteria bacterium]|nr:hypothetical protein [Deltaproteobacteria bacterium]
MVDAFAGQDEPQRWWVLTAQVKSQAVPLHVAVAFAGGVHGVQDVPQFAVLVLETQLVPQA